MSDLGKKGTVGCDHGLHQRGRDGMYLCIVDIAESISEVSTEVRSMLAKVAGSYRYLMPTWCHDIHVALGRVSDSSFQLTTIRAARCGYRCTILKILVSRFVMFFLLPMISTRGYHAAWFSASGQCVARHPRPTIHHTHGTEQPKNTKTYQK